MATFFIQTDKDFYFSGETVNGSVFVYVNSFITGAKGISMKFTGYECVKWVEAQQLHRPAPHNNPNMPPPIDPIALIPPQQIFHSDAPIQISDPESEDDRSYDHRPKYIRNSRGQHFKMSYYETRNMFTKNSSMIYNCNGFQPGQYSFPFSFKSFEGWPASFSHITPRKKGVIIYHMTVAIEPQTPQFQMKFSRQITLRQTRIVQSQTKTSQGEITNCCCFNKGISSATLHFEKDGYMPGELVQMVIEIDNSRCEANINWVNIGIQNTVTLRSNGSSTSDFKSIFQKQLNGIPAGTAKTGNNAIQDSFTLNSSQEIKPTCSGKLLSSTYTLSISMDHDINCSCCSDSIGGSIPVIIFPILRTYALPSTFQNNWQPQVMPATNMALQNNFNNFNLAALGVAQQPQQFSPPQNYPPQNMMPPQQTPQQPNFGQQPQQNFGQQQPNYGQPNYNQNVSFEQSDMNMNANTNQGGYGNNPYQGY